MKSHISVCQVSGHGVSGLGKFWRVIAEKPAVCDNSAVIATSG